MRPPEPSAYLVVAHCRAGFEPEAAIDLGRLAEAAGARIDVDAPVGRGFVVGNLARFDPRPWPRAFERVPPIFVRSLYFGTGPHPLFDPATTRGRPDRVAPLVALIERFRAGFPLRDLQPRTGDHANDFALRLETPDTNDGKELSGLTRALAARLATGLAERGVIRAAAAGARGTNLHVLFPDGAHAYVGASIAPWASPWTMGIPRLRMPGGAPSRSTLKLAEAFVTFLGDREPEVLRADRKSVV